MTIHRGTAEGDGVTRIGSHNLLMAYVHIAHDCKLGNHVIMANGASLAGHIEIQDHATVGAFLRHSSVLAASARTASWELSAW